MIELFIQGDNTMYAPVVLSGLKWELSRRSAPGKLSFSIYDDGKIKLNEGNAVLMSYNGENCFFGFIFAYTTAKDRIVKVIAYDQLRYLKNKETYVYSNMTIDEVVRMIANDFQLNTGELDKGTYKIANRCEDNVTLFDVIENAMDLTLQVKGDMFVLYDDYGKLTLKNTANMITNLMIKDSSAENIQFTSSIDNSYNIIKLHDGDNNVYISKSSDSINKWGILQYNDSIDEGVSGQVAADTLLRLYNTKTRSLTISKCFGDIRIRPGCYVFIDLLITGQEVIKSLMMIESVTHNFEIDKHYMDITVWGGDVFGE